MGAQDNKQLVEDYFRAVSTGDNARVAEIFADDIVWWVPPASPMAGTYEGKEAVFGMFASGVDLYAPEPMKIEIKGMVADDDKVAAEVEITAKTAKGGDYHNHYHFLFGIVSGQIKLVKEYVDTLYAQRTLFS
ncbi:MAG: ketosteroid isomerase-like protein [Hyphomicrobiaceae bacterium]|jgi:ketosteroid isomerase-like protein